MAVAPMTKAKKGKVLVIEDNLLNLDMACELLQYGGFDTYQAEDGETGIRMARQVQPDLILMDLHMPKQDGFATTRQIKSDPTLKDIPIVAFTALAMREDQEKALAAGCSGVICKPIDVSHFSETISRYMNSPGDVAGIDVSCVDSKPPMPTVPDTWVAASPEKTVGSDEPTSPDRPDFSRKEPASSVSRFGLPEQKPFSLQAASAYAAAMVSSPAAPVSLVSSAMDPGSHRILVVDDNPMNVELLKDALESMGQEVIPAYNGQNALKLVDETLPDLILLDIMMPDMDGYAVLNTLKAQPRTADIPVIFISALNRTQDMVRGFQEGTYDYITKPFKVEEVKARILSSLRIKDLQDSLKRERDKLNTIFQFSADGIALMDTEMNIISMNSRFADWFNLDITTDGRPVSAIVMNELLGRNATEDTFGPAQSGDTYHEEARDQAGNTGGSHLREVIIQDAQGQDRYLNFHVGQVQGTIPQEVAGYVVVARDVTTEKTIAQSKETFVATLTHDLKTPIRAEYQAMELLRSGAFGPLQPEQSDILDEILQSNRYMYRLVDSLLTTYMYEEGKAQIKRQLLDLNQLIEQDILPSLNTLASQKNIRLSLNLAQDLPSVPVDPIEIQRVLNNLGQNAITFTPEEGIIEITTGRNGDEVIVSVQDSGSGIPEEDRETLFERYMTRAKRFKQVGTGLGLYLSKMIVEAHQGRINVESQPGQGSRFYFTLPLQPNY